MVCVAIASLSSLHHLSSSLLSISSLSLSLRPSIRHILPRVSCSLSSSTSEFNISFAPAKPKPQPEATEVDSLFGADGSQLFIPWIIRGDDGNLKLQSHPPARLLHAMAHADTKNSKKKKPTAAEKKKKKNDNADKSPAEPKYSKAARRFYNENFRESDQRLSKVLAAAGGNNNISLKLLFLEKMQMCDGRWCEK